MNDLVRSIGFVVYGIYVLTSIWLLLNGLVQLHLLWHYKRKKRTVDAVSSLPDNLPFVTIQIPVYNEKYVIERLLQSLARLEYPTNKFEIQVLDDSTDETVQIIDQQVSQLLKQGIDIMIHRRTTRKGYKAGALQYGLKYCKGELIAIFDADFIPQHNFITRLIPHFSNPKIGLVQARWGHINKDENYLTRIQTFLLDTHFSIEQTGRSNADYFINFCGTAGIWRKQCIKDAGGWDGDVLSEDLDLSYRAQLKGWKLIYDQSTEVPAELPSVIESFKIQQFRWTKGMAQISKKTLGTIMHSTLPLPKKLHGAFHLLSSFVFVCLFINAILTVPLLIYRSLYPEFVILTQYSLITSINLIALTLFYYNGAKSAQQKPTGFFKDYPLFLVIYMGLSVQNAVAVLQGLFGSKSAFVRTPKFSVNSASKNSYLLNKFNWINVTEAATFFYFMFGIFLSIYLSDYFMMLFFVMIGFGLGLILYQSLMLLSFKKLFKPF